MQYPWRNKCFLDLQIRSYLHIPLWQGRGRNMAQQGQRVEQMFKLHIQDTHCFLLKCVCLYLREKNKELAKWKETLHEVLVQTLVHFLRLLSFSNTSPLHSLDHGRCFHGDKQMLCLFTGQQGMTMSEKDISIPFLFFQGRCVLANETRSSSSSNSSSARPIVNLCVR